MTKHEDDRQYAERVAFTAAMAAWRLAANHVLRGTPVDRLNPEAMSYEGIRQVVQRELAADERFCGQLRVRTAGLQGDWLDEQVSQADAVVSEGLERAYGWTVSVLASGAFSAPGLRRRAATIRATALAFGRVALERSVIDHHPSRGRRRRHLAVAGRRGQGDVLAVTAALRDLEWMGTASKKPILKAWNDLQQAGFTLQAAGGHGPSAANGGLIRPTRWDLVIPDIAAGSYALAQATLGAHSPRSSIHGACSVPGGHVPVCLATAARLKAEPLVAVMDVLELVRQWKGGAGGLGPAGVTLALLAVSGYAADEQGWVSKPWLEFTYGLSPSTLADSLLRLRGHGLVEVEWAAEGAGRQPGDRAPRLRGDGVRLAPASTGELRALLQRISVEAGARAALDRVQAGIVRERDLMWAAAERHRLERRWCRACGAKGPDCECGAQERDWVELPAA